MAVDVNTIMFIIEDGQSIMEVSSFVSLLVRIIHFNAHYILVHCSFMWAIQPFHVTCANTNILSAVVLMGHGHWLTLEEGCVKLGKAVPAPIAPFLAIWTRAHVLPRTCVILESIHGWWHVS